MPVTIAFLALLQYLFSTRQRIRANQLIVKLLGLMKTPTCYAIHFVEHPMLDTIRLIKGCIENLTYSWDIKHKYDIITSTSLHTINTTCLQIVTGIKETLSYWDVKYIKYMYIFYISKKWKIDRIFFIKSGMKLDCMKVHLPTLLWWNFIVPFILSPFLEWYSSKSGLIKGGTTVGPSWPQKEYWQKTKWAREWGRLTASIILTYKSKKNKEEKDYTKQH